MKIDPATWATMSKSQKRLARKKLAREKFQAAVLAADRRDTAFVSRITGSLTGKSKGSVPMSFKATKEQRAAVSAYDSVRRAIAQGHAWNAAQVIAGYMDGSKIESSVKARFEAAEIATKAGGTLGEKAQAEKAAEKALNEVNEYFPAVKAVFAADFAFDNLNGILMTAKNDLETASLQNDEAVKSGKAVKTAQKHLDECKAAFEVAKQNLDTFCNTQADQL